MDQYGTSELLKIEEQHVFEVTGAPNVAAGSTRQPRTIEPTQVIVHIRNGYVWLVQVEGLTIRRDGSHGLRRTASWAYEWGENPIPGWVTAIVDRTGRPCRPRSTGTSGRDPGHHGRGAG